MNRVQVVILPANLTRIQTRLKMMRVPPKITHYVNTLLDERLCQLETEVKITVAGKRNQ